MLQFVFISSYLTAMVSSNRAGRNICSLLRDGLLKHKTVIE